MNSRFSKSTDKVAPSFAASILLLAVILCPSSLAQGSSGTQFVNHHLETPPSLRDLPNFGGKYLRGHEYPSNNNVQCWVLKYAFAGTTQQVLSSLQQTMSSQGWHVDQRQAKTEQFTAEKRKDGVTVSIRTQPGRRPGMTVATVRYLILKQQG